MKEVQSLPIVITYDERDDVLHTPEWPRCKDLSCPCQPHPPYEDCDCSACRFVFRVIERVDQQLEFLNDDVEHLRQRDQDRNATQQCSDGSWW